MISSFIIGCPVLIIYISPHKWQRNIAQQCASCCPDRTTKRPFRRDACRAAGTNSFSGTFGFPGSQGTILSFPWDGSAYRYYDRRPTKIRKNKFISTMIVFDSSELWQRDCGVAPSICNSFVQVEKMALSDEYRVKHRVTTTTQPQLQPHLTIIRPTWAPTYDYQAKHQVTTTTQLQPHNLSTKLQVEVVVCLLPQVPPEFWRGGEINFMIF